MELDWEDRHSTAVRPEREWISGNSASSSFTPKSTAQRRRSSIVHAPPALPPPSQPIPSVPVLQMPNYDEHDKESYSQAEASTSGRNGEPNDPYARPHASAGLAAVAAFSQARHRSSSNTSQMSTFSTTSNSTADNLSDSPPPSMLRSTLSVRHREGALPDPSLLRPPESSGGTNNRPSSRRALTKALELAREAVRLDSSNDDPYGAIVAYGRSVALLQEVMGRVMRGEDSTESHRRRNGRRRSVVAQEEEVRRLKSIHDTYADRMNILSLIYNMPAPSQSPEFLYTSVSPSTSAGSTQPPSPDSHSPSSDSSERDPQTLSSAAGDPRSVEFATPDYGINGNIGDIADGVEAIGAAIFTFEASPTDPEYPSSIKINAASSHPYASAHPVANSYPSITPVAPSINISRSPNLPPPRPTPAAPIPGRPRASSTLPPPAPPPIQSPPPAPIDLATEPDGNAALYNKHLDIVRPRGSSITHRRTPSGRLIPVSEESQQQTIEGRLRAGSQPVTRDRDSHPLPPLPTPSQNGSPVTPRYGTVTEPNSPHSPMFNKSRAGSSLSIQSDMSVPTPTPLGRIGSNLSVASDASGSTSSSMQPLINPSTTMGTISQRRSKTSAPPSAAESPVIPPPPGTALNAPPSAMSRFPASTAASLGIVGRSRSSSQPGRRPSLVGGQVIDYTSQHPPMPATAGLAGTNGALRKVSIPSRLNPLSVNTNLSSPPLASATYPPSALSLVPPPPIPHANLPTTPTSPLPPAPPNDALRKPYHLMNLIRHTMTSKSGGYITRRLHVPHEVWTQGGVKLTNLAEKVRVVEVLCSVLEDVEKCSAEVFGAGNVSSGMGLGIGSVGRKEGEAWSAKLEEFSSVCDSVVANFGKKLGVGEGFALQKKSGVTSWGGKLTRQFDKFTAGKNLDSPTAYTQGLCRLFQQAQLLDEHTKAISSVPVAPTYAALPANIRGGLDVKLKHASDFFARVVLTFVIRDLSLLLDKYAKKCEKWLAE
ncbi:hypothetical protein NEOLEDRAFT_1181510 [Neolentinus lepideus HHB14362 ss-1]|uniref:MIT domain-containing protein n=1 Tax=Neolentinus lepideus HHB14362 ss-1 TaxID=1314782 RepID=A0A165PYM2_9AGAM|nr:hypothetical protein NEOLEDRAFT_1181510 [Neolentinus lepideus HHB14362 ss-1]